MLGLSKIQKGQMELMFIELLCAKNRMKQGLYIDDPLNLSNTLKKDDVDDSDSQ